MDLTVVIEPHDLLDVLDRTVLVLADAPVEQAREVVARLPSSAVRQLHFNSAGRNGFEAAGIPDGLIVTNAEGALSPTVAEHAFALVLGLPAGCRRRSSHQRRQWVQSVGEGTRSLDGGTMVLVGLGHIGREVAIRARVRHAGRGGEPDQCGLSRWSTRSCRSRQRMCCRRRRGGRLHRAEPGDDPAS